jgi:nucleotide-binding universal stress UspA family protein
MERIKNILIPLTFTAESRNILGYALYVAEAFNAKATVFHVLREPKVDMAEIDLEQGFLEKVKEHQAEEAKKELEQLIPREYFQKYDLKTDMKWGQPYVEIVNEAKRLNADLIIMGTHGRTGLSHVLIGSVAEKVLRLAPCPVMVIRSKKYKYEPL